MISTILPTYSNPLALNRNILNIVPLTFGTAWKPFRGVLSWFIFSPLSSAPFYWFTKNRLFNLLKNTNNLLETMVIAHRVYCYSGYCSSFRCWNHAWIHLQRTRTTIAFVRWSIFWLLFFLCFTTTKKNRKGRAMLQMNDHMCTGVMFTNERFLYRKGLVVNVF